MDSAWLGLAITRMLKRVGFIHSVFSSVRPSTCSQISPLRLTHSQSNSPETCGLSIYSTLTKRKEALRLKNSNVLYWYSCGPTVYDSAHIGHACSYVNLDIIRRILAKHFRINVVNLMNITDIDDKIIKRAVKDKKDFTEISAHYEAEFLQDLRALNCLGPSIVLRVSQHVKEIQAFISNLISRDLAYVAKSGSVYFSSQKFKLEPFIAQTLDHEGDPKAKENLEKTHPSDFALWKARKEPNEPAWKSPWGFGRPGWHIECSTLASIAFGKHLDVHSGGKDLIFPHHQNEIIQCCAYHDLGSWSTYWVHTGHLHLKGDVKMSKSLQNTISIRELLAKYTSNQFRLFCLLSPYRYDKEFTDEKMQKSVALDYTFTSFFNLCKTYCSPESAVPPLQLADEAQVFTRLDQARASVHEALCDDFNTPKVIEELSELVSFMNRLFQSKQPQAADSDGSNVNNRHYGPVMSVSNFIEDTLDTFGMSWQANDHQQTNASSGVKIEQVIDASIKFRKQVRNLALDKSTPKEVKMAALKLCDELRVGFQKANVELKDTKDNTMWQIRPDQN